MNPIEPTRLRDSRISGMRLEHQWNTERARTILSANPLGELAETLCRVQPSRPGPGRLTRTAYLNSCSGHAVRAPLGGIFMPRDSTQVHIIGRDDIAVIPVVRGVDDPYNLLLYEPATDSASVLQIVTDGTKWTPSISGIDEM